MGVIIKDVPLWSDSRSGDSVILRHIFYVWLTETICRSLVTTMKAVFAESPKTVFFSFTSNSWWAWCSRFLSFAICLLPFASTSHIVTKNKTLYLLSMMWWSKFAIKLNWSPRIIRLPGGGYFSRNDHKNLLQNDWRWRLLSNWNWNRKSPYPTLQCLLHF